MIRERTIAKVRISTVTDAVVGSSKAKAIANSLSIRSVRFIARDVLNYAEKILLGQSVVILSHPNLFDILTECHKLGENENATSHQSRHDVHLWETSDMNDLTGFQRDLLYVIRGLDEPHGLALKDELEKYYEGEVHYGRLYPSLQTLVDKGLVEKGQPDERTNSYTLTDQARRELEARRDWEDTSAEPLLSM